MNENHQFHGHIGAPVARAEDENYRTTDKCDGCGTRAAGTMFHAAGATGRVCPVLFLCDGCAARPWRARRAPADAQSLA